MPDNVSVVSLPIPGDHAAAREARWFVLQHLPEHAASDDIDRILLCVSELVSNAIEHGSPPRHLELVVTGRHVRVEVRDADTHQPEPQTVSSQALRGRGLQIVATTSDRWGVEMHPDGKVVWFEASVSIET